MGLLTAMLDTPYHTLWSNTKSSNSKTNKPCSTCEITQEELGNHRYDFEDNMRTQDGIDEALAYVKAGPTAAEQARRSTEKGVVVPDAENPLKKLIFDRVRMLGVDIFHQDALVSEHGLSAPGFMTFFMWRRVPPLLPDQTINPGGMFGVMRVSPCAEMTYFRKSFFFFG